MYDQAQSSTSTALPASDFTAASESRTHRIDIALFASLSILSFTVYLKTLCPTVFTDDCGEITTAVATGGVIHPPGYPLYTLLGRLFIALIPNGEPAWRLGLVSAVCGAFAVGTAYILARRLGAGPIWAAIGATAFAFSVCLWEQATKVETYTLNAFLIGLVWNGAARYQDAPTLKRLALAALCCGLALTNHLTAVCAIAGAAAFLPANLKRSPAPVAASVAVAAICAAAPLGLYGLLWLDASSHPGGQVWGDPDNWRGFFLQITGARYHPYFANQSGPDMAQRDIVGLPAILWHNLGPLLIATVPGVARASWVSGARRNLALGLLISLAAYLAETTVYGILNIFEYYTPVVMILAVFAASGGEAIVRGIKSLHPERLASGRRALSAACLAVTLLAAPIVHWPYCDRSNATFMRDLALNTLGSLPENAVVIVTGDNRVFPMWYVQDVLGFRRDVTVVPRHALDTLSGKDGILMMGWLVDKLAAQHPAVVDAAAILQKAQSNPAYAAHEGPTWDIAVRALSQNDDLFLTDPQPQDTHVNAGLFHVLNAIGPDLILSPYGLVDQIIPQQAFADIRIRANLNLALWKRMTIVSAPDALMQDEPDGNITNLAYSVMLSRTADLLAKNAQLDDAQRAMAIALACRPTPDNFNAMGYIDLRDGRIDQAERNYRQAVLLDPSNIEYQNDLLYVEKETAEGASNLSFAQGATTQ